MNRSVIGAQMKSKVPNRVMIYSHDTYGLGHLRRNLALAEALVRANPTMRIVIVSGSRIAASFEVCRGVDVVQLPPVIKTGPGQYESYGLAISLSLIKRARAAIIKDVIARFDPEVFYVDHSPLGMSNELVSVLDFLVSSRAEIRRVIGLRDIIDSPESVTRSWAADGTLEAIGRFYHQAYVFGEEHLFDFGSAYAIPSNVELRYLSYLGKPEFIAAGQRRTKKFSNFSSHGGHFLVTGGGGGDAKEVCELGIRVAQIVGVETVVVTGPLMDFQTLCELRELAKGAANIKIIEFSSNFEDLVANARVAMAMAGYNTTVELAAARVPALYLPRTYPRQEQAIRAEIFARLGFGKTLDPNAAATPGSIAPMVRTYWDNPLLAPEVALNMSAIPRFASQIATPEPTRRDFKEAVETMDAVH